MITRVEMETTSSGDGDNRALLIDLNKARAGSNHPQLASKSGQPPVAAVARPPSGGNWFRGEVGEKFDQTIDESLRGSLLQSGGNELQFLDERDIDAIFGCTDKLNYTLGAIVVASPSMKYILLMVLTGLGMAILAQIWTQVADTTSERTSTTEFGSAMFFVFEVFATGAFQTDMTKRLEQCVYAVIVMAGLIVFATLVGLISNSINDALENGNEGRTKVVENGHTLILGWNAATIRVVCQIAFLRRQWQMQNETCVRRMFPWTRMKASTPVAVRPVVILGDRVPKQEMDEALEHALLAEGIDPARTKVGWNVITRFGDPTDIHALVRVNAQTATSILLMMTETDVEESTQSAESIEAAGVDSDHAQKLQNSASLRCLMALRHVTYTTRNQQHIWGDKRIVVHATSDCSYMESILMSPNGYSVVKPLDLSGFVNVLMFECASKPGISRILLSLFSFESAAFRCRPIKDMRAGSENEAGWLAGQTISTALKKNCWEHSVLVGVCAKRGTSQHGCGILGDPDRVILKSDLAIFIARTSMPRVASDVPTDKLTSTYKHSMPTEQNKDRSKRLRASQVAGSDCVQSFLVCGWRDAWTKTPKKLFERIKEIGARSDAETVQISFLNLFSDKEFDRIMNEIKATPDESLPDVQTYLYEGMKRGLPYKMRLRHFQGDAVSQEDLSTVLKTDDFEVALVLSTQVGVGLGMSPILQDSRILTICMMLRHLNPICNPASHIRICSENNVDQTAALALTPQRTGNNVQKFPDFINTQAIYARALTLALAYPDMQPVIEDMFYSGKSVAAGELRSPEFELYDTISLGVTGLKLSPNDMQEVFTMLSEQGGLRTIMIGYIDQDQGFHLAPPAHVTRLWQQEEKVIAIQRKPKTSNNDDLNPLT